MAEKITDAPPVALLDNCVEIEGVRLNAFGDSVTLRRQGSGLSGNEWRAEKVSSALTKAGAS